MMLGKKDAVETGVFGDEGGFENLVPAAGDGGACRRIGRHEEHTEFHVAGSGGNEIPGKLGMLFFFLA